MCYCYLINTTNCYPLGAELHTEGGGGGGGEGD